MSTKNARASGAQQVASPPLLTLSAALRAMAALRELHRVCEAMDADRAGERPSEEEYQAAMSEAADVLARA